MDGPETPSHEASISALLAPGGAVARRLGDGFEPRPQQAEMAEAVERNMDEGGVLLAEAGTGVGKSFAYLLPAARRIIEKGERVVVATNTIALQEQLLEKDVPVVRDALGGEFSAVLVKGRGNYLSLRRLALASKRQGSLMPDAPSARSLHAIEDWAYTTDDGTLATLPVLEREAVWEHARSDSGNCMGRKCPTYDKCFYQRARRRMEHGDLLVCNHALFFSDLALRLRGAAFLPNYDHVILDEAHGVEDVATEHFGVRISETRVARLLSLLDNERGSGGYLTTLRVAPEGDAALRRAREAVANAGAVSRIFFEDAGRLAGDPSGVESSRRVPEDSGFDNILSPAMEEVAIVLSRLKEHATGDEDRFELNSYSERAQAAADDARALIEQSMPGCVYWAEARRVRRSRGPETARVTLACCPIEVGPLLKERLFNGSVSVTCASATITTGAKDFAHTAGRLGVDLERDDVSTLSAGSPFDLPSQMAVYVDPAMPDPRDPRHADLLADRIIEQALTTRGGAFVLFTSNASLRQMAERCGPDLEDAGLTPIAQGRDGPAGVVLKRFTETDGAVLFGTASFWQGVDVLGEALRNVIITRLPFEPPDRPITTARHDRIRERGGNPFMSDTLPRAVIRFKQGVGRLIRSGLDTGRVVVLDSRVSTKRYGRDFLAALPEGVRVEPLDPPMADEDAWDDGGGFL